MTYNWSSGSKLICHTNLYVNYCKTRVYVRMIGGANNANSNLMSESWAREGSKFTFSLHLNK